MRTCLHCLAPAQLNDNMIKTMTRNSLNNRFKWSPPRKCLKYCRRTWRPWVCPLNYIFMYNYYQMWKQEQFSSLQKPTPISKPNWLPSLFPLFYITCYWHELLFRISLSSHSLNLTKRKWGDIIQITPFPNIFFSPPQVEQSSKSGDLIILQKHQTSKRKESDRHRRLLNRCKWTSITECQDFLVWL